MFSISPQVFDCMARWLKAEFLQYSHKGGFFILVNLLSGFGVGVDGGGMGTLESGMCGGVTLTSMPFLVGVVGGMVSFLGV